MAIKFKNVPENEFQESEKLGVGTHLVKISKIKSEKDGEQYTDKNGNPYALIVFENQDKLEHAETFFFGGGMAYKTSRLLKAIGLLDADEDIRTTDKEFEFEDFIGAGLNITIEEDEKATNPKYKLKIASEGFEAMGAATPKKAKPKAEAPF